MSINDSSIVGSKHFFFPFAFVFRQYLDFRSVLISIIMSFFKKMTKELDDLKSTFSGGSEKKEHVHEGKIIREADATPRKTHWSSQRHMTIKHLSMVYKLSSMGSHLTDKAHTTAKHHQHQHQHLLTWIPHCHLAGSSNGTRPAKDGTLSNRQLVGRNGSHLSS